MTVPAVLLPPDATGTIRYAWIEAGGTRHELDGGASGVAVLADNTGRLWMPPTTIGRMALPLADGGWATNVRTDEREIDLALHLTAANLAALHLLKRQVLGWFKSSRGSGTLEVTAADGTARQIACTYLDGLGLTESLDQGGETWQDADVTLLAVDPYWQDADDTEVSFGLDEGTVLFLPFVGRPGFYLTASSLYAVKSVSNDGDIAAEPVWTIAGPGSNVVLRNLTTGKVLALSITLLAGDVLTVDTRERATGYAIYDQSGNNLLALAATPPQLWTLQQGENIIRVEMDGASSGTSVTLAYRNRYLSP